MRVAKITSYCKEHSPNHVFFSALRPFRVESMDRSVPEVLQTATEEFGKSESEDADPNRRGGRIARWRTLQAKRWIRYVGLGMF